MIEITSPLVSAEWLKENLSSEAVIVLDATWFLPKFERSGKSEFLVEHIPGSRFFDYDTEICDKTSEFPRMMPSADFFTETVQKLGVCKDSVIILYDNNGMFSSPRAWYMFKAMGHEQMAVLNGGLNAWKAAGGALSSELSDIQLGDFIATENKDAFIDAQTVLSHLDSIDRAVLDARGKERFDEAHMLGAKNLPYVDLLSDGMFKTVEELTQIYASIISKGSNPTFSCGSGVTACILALGANLCGYKNISVYDASWSEWGKKEHLPKEGS